MSLEGAVRFWSRTEATALSRAVLTPPPRARRTTAGLLDDCAVLDTQLIPEILDKKVSQEPDLRSGKTISYICETEAELWPVMISIGTMSRR